MPCRQSAQGVKIQRNDLGTSGSKELRAVSVSDANADFVSSMQVIGPGSNFYLDEYDFLFFFLYSFFSR